MDLLLFLTTHSLEHQDTEWCALASLRNLPTLLLQDNTASWKPSYVPKRYTDILPTPTPSPEIKAFTRKNDAHHCEDFARSARLWGLPVCHRTPSAPLQGPPPPPTPDLRVRKNASYLETKWLANAPPNPGCWEKTRQEKHPKVFITCRL